jgi:hypothetical protein
MSRLGVASWLAMTSPKRRPLRAARRPAAAAVALALSVSWLVTAPSEASAGTTDTTHRYQRACSPAPARHAACDVIIQTSPAPQRALPNITPSGYSPNDLQDAYDLPSDSAGVGRVVAIVDAFDSPRAEADMAAYRTQYGLSPCTTANGCFLKVNQDGNTSPLPATDDGWAIEIALDLEMVSASCPNCAIVLVEADNANVANLAQAAATGGSYADAVSNSYGSNSEFVGEGSLDPFYSVPGVVYTASSGDSGVGAQYPAASPEVVAVGGTTLNTATNARGWTETAWSGTGSGCSTKEAKPVWQTDTGCSMRTEVDVSAVADPTTGVATFAPFSGLGNPSTWGIAGGTSASAPLIAGAYMVAGGPPIKKAARLPYDRGGEHLNDVVLGTNGACGTYVCQAGVGYDGPTGIGTPAGVRDLRSLAGVGQYDALGYTQFAVYRPSTHRWYLRDGTSTTWGASGDIPVPADYFGDTFVDPTMYRPSTHRWYIQNFGATITWGTTGDIPVAGDFNGDGVSDITVYRPSNHTWYARGAATIAWGASHDTPVPGDYNGDGVTEAAIYRPSTHQWWIRGVGTFTYGKTGDVPVPGDYNGDGATEIALFRPSTHQWWINGNAPITWGASRDAPEPGDYNGDGVTDIGTWRPSNGTWYVRGFVSQQWGASGDTGLVLPYAINRTR